jgi:hypothetical protein
VALYDLIGTGALARVRTYVSTRGRKDLPDRPAGLSARRELDEEVGRLAEVLDRRLDRDASYGQDVLLRCDGRDLAVAPAALGMCTTVRGEGFVAGDLVLDENTLVDLNALESGSIEVYADSIAFRHVDGTRIELVTLPRAATIQ